MPLPTGFSVPAPKLAAPPVATPPVPVPPVAEAVEKPSLSAKDLALYVGVPVATLCVAGGLYYYYTKSDDDAKDATDGGEGAPVAVVAPMESDKGKQETVEEDTRTPLEKAEGAKGKGNKYFKAGRFDQAIECYTKAIEHCPTDQPLEMSTYYQNRAAAHEQLKKWKEVIVDTTKAISLNPKYAKALARRAKAHDVTNEKRLALEDITAVCLLEGFSNQNNMILADRILKTFGKELAEAHFKARPRILPSATFVRSYLDSFNEDLFAINVAEEDKGKTKYEEISTKMKNKDYDNVIMLCTQEIDGLGPYKNRCLLLRATLYTLMSDIEKAVADFDAVIELDDSEENKKFKIDALIKRGSLKMQQADDKGCFADFDKAIAIDEDSPNIHHHRGQLYFLTERLQEGRNEFEKTIELDKNFVAPRLQLGYCICKQAMQAMSPTMMKEADAVLEETTRLFPNCPEAWSLHGQLLQDQQKLEPALEKLEKAISMAPENPTTYVYKALLLLQWKQDTEGAIKLIKEAVRLDDKCDFAFETLATLEVQRGNNEEAIRLFGRAVDLVRTEAEMANTFSLMEAAKAQSKVTKLYGITLPKMPGMM
eukprot:TCONS_00033062-protein